MTTADREVLFVLPAKAGRWIQKREKSLFLKLPAPPHQAIDSAGGRGNFFYFQKGTFKIKNLGRWSF